jgi:hypothetical protein
MLFPIPGGEPHLSGLRRDSVCDVGYGREPETAEPQDYQQCAQAYLHGGKRLSSRSNRYTIRLIKARSGHQPGASCVQVRAMKGLAAQMVAQLSGVIDRADILPSCTS